MDAGRTLSPPQAQEFEARLDALLARVDQLPTLPQILWEIRAQLRDSQNAAADLASSIEDDPSLTANVLRLANSAFYGFSERIISVTDAVVAIGRREIERMVYATLAIDVFGARDPRGSMDYTAYWTHSLQAAQVAESISMHHFKDDPNISSEAYLGGLLHDVGKLILNQFLPEDWVTVRAYADRHRCSDADAERATIGMDHGEVAARLMEAWALSPTIVEGTRWHHRPSGSGREHVAQAELIGFADSICHAYARGPLPERGMYHSRFSLDEKQVAALTRTLKSAALRATVLLS